MRNKIAALFPKRNTFDLSFTNKFTCAMGDLIPVLVKEVLPGDTFHINHNALIRLIPQVAPTMEKLVAHLYTFFVPDRLNFNGYEEFYGGGVEGDDDTVYPYKVLSSVAEGSLADYLGIPPADYSALVGVDPDPAGLRVNAMPFRAYAKIFNDWFRDQNFTDPVDLVTTDGYDNTTSVSIKKKTWEQGYFRNALPSTQRGDAIQIPIGASADVTIYNTNGQLDVGVYDGTSWKGGINVDDGIGGGYDNLAVNTENHGKTVTLKKQSSTDDRITGTADLTTAEGINVNELRMLIQIQKWFERAMRAGVRYIETILAHFGVRSSDSRLQRAEYLGGAKFPIVISEIPQTSASSTTPQGNLAGHGVGVGHGKTCSKSFEEHGIIMTLMCIKPYQSFQQGLHRMWSRRSKFDFFWPEFAHLGEQAILKKEIYLQNSEVNVNDEPFGYVPRGEEYRVSENETHGQFRSSLDTWTMTTKFTGPVALNESFVECNPTKRIFAVPSSTHTCLVMLANNVTAVRPVPRIGEPGLLDHN